MHLGHSAVPLLSSPILNRQGTVQCPRCGHENLPGSRFCSQCGNKLEMTCPVCSVASTPDARFCSNCGNSLTSDPDADAVADVSRYATPELLSKITAARSAQSMRGERRTVTMLFGDIQGSTAAAEGLDPEDWTEIMNGAFEHLIAPVYRYEGTLARLLGDAVLAFFGAPIAHEDDPVRAVRAGLEIVEGMESYRDSIRDKWGIPINVRVGINTGLVVVGEVGSDLRVEYTALGDAVNVAARMEQTADPGTVRVTGETWALLSGQFEGEEIGPVEVKGKSEPVTAVRVLAVCALSEDPGARAPLIGRYRELEDLDDLRSRLMSGTGWISSIMGEAGVGKSRLIDELRRRTIAATSTATAARDPGEVSWMSSFSESYDSSVPYSTIRDLLTRWWRLDQVAEPYRVVEEMVGEVMADERDAAVYLGYLAGITLPEEPSRFLEKLEPPTLQARARETIAKYVAAEAARRPLFVVLEDIHWADPMSLAIVEDLMLLAEKASVGLAFSMRPYRDEPTWHVHEVAQRDHPHRYRTFDLSTLADDDAERLLGRLLESVSLSEHMRRRIVERSGGNPLFIEQMAGSILEEGMDEDLPVPSGLTALLTARLDRLASESRMVAQVASVIGSEFERSTLQALVGDELDLDQHLTDLLRRGMFVERPGVGSTLAFYHALMHEAAYSTMLLRTRRQLHGRLAEYLASATPDASQEIARHFLEANQTNEAFPHLVAAGERSAFSMALSDAIRFFTAALDNIPSDVDPELVVRAHDGLGVAYTLVPDLTQSEAAYQRLADYADLAGRPAAKVTALNRLAMTTATLGGDLDTARGYLDDAFAIAQEVGDELGLAEYHMNSCTIAGIGGDIATALVHDEATIQKGQDLGSEGIRIEGMVRLAGNSVWLMDFDRAIPAVEDALEAAREAGDELSVAVLNAMVVSRLRLRDGDVEGALQLLLDNEETLIRYASFYTPLILTVLGVTLFERGEVESAITRISSLRRAVVQQKVPFFVAVTSAALAHIYASLGMTESMREMRESAVESVEAPLGDFLSSTVWADLGYASLACGHLETADGDLRRGLEQSSASRFWEKSRLLILRAIVQARLGNPDEAHRILDEAQTYLLGREVRAFDAHLGYGRGVTLLAEGNPEKASESLVEALDVAVTMGYRPLANKIRLAAAKAAAARGERNAAADLLDDARAEVEAMAAAVVDEELRSALRAAWLTPLEQTAAGN